MMSTVLPFIALTMSPGRAACGAAMFSPAVAIAMRGVPGARRATVTMAAITVQAPVLSIFISSIEAAGLMLIPPESKQTPLPMRASRRPAASFSPSAPERNTIIRGGLSLPAPTAKNMPLPHTPGGVGALADDHATLRGTPQGSGIGAGGDQNQLLERGRHAVVVIAVDRGGLELALDNAPGQQLSHGRSATFDVSAKIADPERQTPDRPAGQPALHRGPDPNNYLKRDRLRLADAHGQETTGRQFTSCRHDGVVALAFEFTERCQRGEFAAGPLV